MIKSIGILWTALYVNSNKITYFDSVGVEHIPKDIKNIMENRNIIINIFTIQTCNSIMCGYFCIGLYDFILKGKSFLDYTNLFSPNDYEKKNKITLKYFHLLKRWKSYIGLFAVSIEIWNT